MSDDDFAQDVDRIAREYVAWQQAQRERRAQADQLLAALDEDLAVWALAEIDGGTDGDTYLHVMTWVAQHAERDGDVVAEALILARWPKAYRRARELAQSARVARGVAAVPEYCPGCVTSETTIRERAAGIRGEPGVCRECGGLKR